MTDIEPEFETWDCPDCYAENEGDVGVCYKCLAER